MLTTSHIQAPAGLFCDASSGRRTGVSARGYVRCPILDLFHEFCGEHANAAPRLLSLAVLPAQLGVSGFGRGAPSISKRDPSAKIPRASQHSASPSSTCEHPQMNTGVPSDGAEISFRT